jgi:hypothetical protein
MGTEVAPLRYLDLDAGDEDLGQMRAWTVESGVDAAKGIDAPATVPQKHIQLVAGAGVHRWNQAWTWRRARINEQNLVLQQRCLRKTPNWCILIKQGVCV